MPEWFHDVALGLIALVGYFANRTLQGIDQKLDKLNATQDTHGSRITTLEEKTRHLEEIPKANIRSKS
jgi:hypothetical protein